MAKFSHKTIEKNSILLLVLTLIVVSIGGLVEIVPLFWIKSTIEEVDGVRPYTPLELAGRNIYVREGCYNCHSQMVRSLRSEVDRYGHYSLAAESMYDHPFQWGSKRTGPDLARLGNKYSDEWHRLHMAAPRSVVPESVMPGYPFLAKTPLDMRTVKEVIAANAKVGVPYDEAMIENAAADLLAQLDPYGDIDGLMERYGDNVAIRDFDGNPRMVSELDALIAYLQVLGTFVDFNAYNEQAAGNER
ncbi:cytochrome c oxidase, cbb3-type subunit II [Iodidimonas muriae]|uniref:Cytochrome c oxidase, cbb3-type subunit II n=1 Tax=Iodidimonas muriae TaxID=261467 RepID=A0ABQ2LES0_9PROT|nr:cytochrome-c oxidase, cbb3-type subunit II [Iodidimonas muriae]GER07532.1 cytochrome c oxidase, cbb3-type subunit II [Kordiimonadales bacterium JCM 17843]GGO14110.1 cytochrome c oxidase, cbb3-type subunit II [Iodidimonas muriae]